MENGSRAAWVLSLVGSVLVLLSGCVGPLVLQGSRDQYNKAVHESANTELLLNLVRVRYREPVSFLQIGAINATFDYSASASFAASIPVGPAQNSYNVGAGLGYAEKPTITFSPLVGAEFAQRTQKEMALSDLVLLLRSNWNIAQVMRLTVERFGKLYNSDEQPSYAAFIELMRLWSALQARGDLRLVYVPAGASRVVADTVPSKQVTVQTMMQADKDGYRLRSRQDGQYELVKPAGRVLVLQLTYADEAEATQADGLLGIAPKHLRTLDGRLIERLTLIDPLEAARPAPQGQEVTAIAIWLRSFSNQLFYASRSVEIPSTDQDRVKTYVDPQGQSIDPRHALTDILDIRLSRSKPSDAIVAARYRRHWFYIDDRDQASKDTFHLLTVIFALQSEAPGIKPVLTIPVR